MFVARVPVKGYNNYLIYEDGRCWSNFTNKFLKEGKRKYNNYNLSKDGIRKTIEVHILVGNHFLPPKPTPKHEIDHIDRNKKNNHISNLRWATRSEQEINKEQRKSFLGHRNIYIHGNNFQAKVTRNNIDYCIGTYATLEEAIRQRETYLINLNQALERNQ